MQFFFKEYENKISDEIGQIQKISDIPPVKERTILKAEKTTNDYEISQNEVVTSDDVKYFEMVILQKATLNIIYIYKISIYSKIFNIKYVPKFLSVAVF